MGEQHCAQSSEIDRRTFGIDAGEHSVCLHHACRREEIKIMEDLGLGRLNCASEDTCVRAIDGQIPALDRLKCEETRLDVDTPESFRVAYRLRDG